MGKNQSGQGCESVRFEKEVARSQPLAAMFRWLYKGVGVDEIYDLGIRRMRYRHFHFGREVAECRFASIHEHPRRAIDRVCDILVRALMNREAEPLLVDGDDFVGHFCSVRRGECRTDSKHEQGANAREE